MKIFRRVALLLLLFSSAETSAQLPIVEPRVGTQTERREKVAVVNVAPRFVTAIRLPDTVNSLVVGDPSAFQVEHSEHEPRLVFVKSLSTRPAKSNVLITITGGREYSLLLVSYGEQASSYPVPVDFLLTYEISGGFLITPSAFPSALVGATVSLDPATGTRNGVRNLPGKHIEPAKLEALSVGVPQSAHHSAFSQEEVGSDQLQQLLEQQERAPLPVLYGRFNGERAADGDRIRAGIGRVLDDGQEVVVLFSVVNATRHSMLLMPPQVQLGGKAVSGTFMHHQKWSTAEQLPVLDFRLNRRRLSPAERADGVVVFERPPYKRSNETLLLQVAESGAVDRPALAPIGFGVGTWPEDERD